MIRLADDEVIFELENLSLSIQKSPEDIGDDFRQSHYIEVAQGNIFIEQKMRFGLVLGRLAILKKTGADYEQLLRKVFSCFQGQKNIFFFC